MSNTRVWLHVVSAMLLLIIGGVVGFRHIFGDYWPDVVSLAILINVGIQAYMATTTTGITAAQAKRRVEHLIESRQQAPRVQRRKS